MCMAGYRRAPRAAIADGALDIKTKELIALSIAITRECDGCIAAHGRNLARLGATTEEVAEMIGVAITMNGGPGLLGPTALEAPSSTRPGRLPRAYADDADRPAQRRLSGVAAISARPA